MSPLAVVGVPFLLVAVFAIPACLAFQAYLWLKSGTWFELNTIDLLVWAGLMQEAQFNHLYENWRGIVKILEFLNAGVSVSVVSGILTAVFFSYEK